MMSISNVITLPEDFSQHLDQDDVQFCMSAAKTALFYSRMNEKNHGFVNGSAWELMLKFHQLYSNQKEVIEHSEESLSLYKMILISVQLNLDHCRKLKELIGSYPYFIVRPNEECKSQQYKLCWTRNIKYLPSDRAPIPLSDEQIDAIKKKSEGQECTLMVIAQKMMDYLSQVIADLENAKLGESSSAMFDDVARHSINASYESLPSTISIPDNYKQVPLTKEIRICFVAVHVALFLTRQKKNISAIVDADKESEIQLYVSSPSSQKQKFKKILRNFSLTAKQCEALRDAIRSNPLLPITSSTLKDTKSGEEIWSNYLKFNSQQHFYLLTEEQRQAIAQRARGDQECDIVLITEKAMDALDRIINVLNKKDSKDTSCCQLL